MENRSITSTGQETFEYFTLRPFAIMIGVIDLMSSFMHIFLEEIIIYVDTCLVVLT